MADNLSSRLHRRFGAPVWKQIEREWLDNVGLLQIGIIMSGTCCHACFLVLIREKLSVRDLRYLVWEVFKRWLELGSKREWPWSSGCLYIGLLENLQVQLHLQIITLDFRRLWQKASFALLVERTDVDRHDVTGGSGHDTAGLPLLQDLRFLGSRPLGEG